MDIGNSQRFSYLGVCHVPENNTLYNCVSSASSLAPNKDNAVRLLASDAAALNAGSKIADGEKFQLPARAALMLGRGFYYGSRTQQTRQGPWANGGKGVKNRYLGFKFKINGQFHYGWARLTVTTTPHSAYTATLTGYAYETTPNKGIVAGQESGPAEIGDSINDMNKTKAFRPVSLGLLGLGAVGLALWRRKEDSQD